jgi:hypothetical protein
VTANGVGTCSPNRASFDSIKERIGLSGNWPLEG